MSLAGPQFAGDGSGGGVGDLPMLRLLADPDALKERLAQLTAAQQAAEKAVALVGPAERIPLLEANAEKASQAAQAALEEALARAKASDEDAAKRASAMILDAQEQAKRIMDEAEVERANVALELSALEESKKAAEAANASEEQRLQDWSADLEAKSRSLEIAQAAAAKAEAEHTAEALRLANLLEQIKRLTSEA